MPADFLHPFVLGTPGQFAQLRQILVLSGYNMQAVQERSGIESIFDFEVQRTGAYEPRPFADRLDLFLQMLMHGNIARESDVLALLRPSELEVLEILGVLARSPEDATLLYSTAALYPVENVYAASDRTFPPYANFNGDVPSDVVFAAISRHTRIFLGSIPRDGCERFLDLCAGSGIAGLLAGANFATHAHATDLGERCVHFAEFSRRLNGLDNVATASGDLYAAVPGQQFDRIVAHPPYIPSKDVSILFRDGGEDGEQIFRRIIEGLPEALAPGGRLHCVTFATDRKSGELEERVRAWLGPDEADFDVVLVASEMRNRPDNILKNVEQSQKVKLGESAETLERLGVTRLFYGSVMVQRKHGERAAFSARTFRSPRAPLAASEHYRALVSQLHSVSMSDGVAEAKPSLARDFRLIVTHQPGPEGLNPTNYLLALTYPWVTEAKTEAWIAALLSVCNGIKSLRDIYDELRTAGIMSSETTPEQFWGLVRLLAVNGYLEFENAFLDAVN